MRCNYHHSCSFHIICTVLLEQSTGTVGVCVKHLYGTGKPPKIKDPHPPIKTYPPFPQPRHGPFRLSYLHLLLLLSGGRTPHPLGLHIGYFHLGLVLPGIWHHLSNSSDCQQIQMRSSPVTTIVVYVFLGISQNVTNKFF